MLVLSILSVDSCKNPKKKSKSLEKTSDDESSKEELGDQAIVDDSSDKGATDFDPEIYEEKTSTEDNLPTPEEGQQQISQEESIEEDKAIDTVDATEKIFTEEPTPKDQQELEEPLSEELPAVEEPIVDDIEEEQGIIKDIIEYEADSMFFDLKKSQVGLLGNSNVTYGMSHILAHEVSIDWHKNEMLASSKEIDKKVALEDKIGLMLEGVEYFAEKIKINFESQRATVKGLFTKIDDGFLRVKKMKRDYEDVLYIDEMSFTTCNLIKPHFGIWARKAKITDKKEFVSGPVHLAFNDVQTMTFFFGLFHMPDKNHGIIPPRYGGSSDKGIHVKEFGYYWNFDDLVDLAITADAHSGGTFGINTESYYKKRYLYGGDILYKQSKEIIDNRSDAKWKFAWKHASENNRTSSFTSDISFENEQFRKEESKKSGNSQNATAQSSIKYTNKLLDVPLYSLGVKVSYNKNFTKDETSAVLPSIILQTYNIYPLRGNSIGGSWYRDVNIRHSVEFKNKITTKNNYLNFFKNSDWPDLYKKKKYGIKHIVPLKTNIKIGYFNLIPGIEYKDRWYWESLDHFSEPKRVKGFQRVWDYEPSTELTTTFYGTFLYTKNKSVEAIRHQAKPSLKLVYTPTFEKDYWQTVDGKPKSRFENFVFETPGENEKLVLYGSLANVLEMKLRPQTEEEEAKKVPILENFESKASYDFLAKEFPVGDIEFKARTKIFDGAINIEVSRTYDPYFYDELSNGEYNRVEKLAMNNNQGLGHLKKAKLTIGTELKSQQENQDPLAQMMEGMKRQYAYENPEEASQNYVDFSIPWTLKIQYDYTFEAEKPNTNMKRSRVISSEYQINMTEKWVFGIKSGYDFTEEQVVKDITKISAYRDLHCWQLTFSWLPIATTQWFEFSVGIKAPILQSLKYTRGDKPYRYV